MSNAALTPDRQTFRALVADIAAKAREKLPQAVNGRIESAVKLVLAHDVRFCDDGTVEVGSASDPMKTYTLAGQACDCQDFSYGQAPDGWCQHRLAAGIAKRVQEVLGAPAPEPDPVGLPTMAPVHAPVAATGAPEPLYEAPASVNVRLTIAGREVQWTLRDTDEARLADRLMALLARFPQPQAAPPAQPPAPASQGQLSPQQHNAAAMHRKVTDFCPVHNVQMKLNQKEGRSWYSHYDESAGRWCKGR